MIGCARFARDVFRTFTWRTFLLSQLLAVAIEIIAVLSFVMPLQPPASFSWSRVVIEETMAVSIVLALLAANQAIARGARQVPAFAIAILAASVSTAVVQFEVRHWLGIYTNGDRPGIEMSRRRLQMVYAGSDTLTYGVLFLLMYADYQRRERLLTRIREVELERAHEEQRVLRSRLAAMRSSIDAQELMTRLVDVQRLFEQDSPDADRLLDDLVAGLRARLTPLEPARTTASV